MTGLIVSYFQRTFFRTMNKIPTAALYRAPSINPKSVETTMDKERHSDSMPISPRVSTTAVREA